MNGDSWVIDASVLAQLYIVDEDEQFTDLAKTIVRRHTDGRLELVAPQFILYEVPSAIHRAVRRRRLALHDARLAIGHFFNLQLHTLGTEDSLSDLIQFAYDRATQLNCHVYDALYLVVAEVLDIPFITADRKLYRQVRNELDYVVWIADFESYEHHQ
ncbi:MAG: type II toxin-antitoxin system VapC family toxin [Chloroflexi bacterium]|nr:type II toxin-antitoxin system VapC family toxin [Chloroflexota bacterium]MCH8009588.1 type II toxin-antitoxin system VapC family toxin [Chloroflexota bacterium]MCH8161550.1 type II toxin-antitoxin system VapC family toxin [Chloroflexota bacterium]